MASLDIDALLQAISPQAPCGDNLEDAAAFMALQDKAKIIPEQVLGDIKRAEQLPNWRDVRADLLKLLEKTRDLRLLVELARTNLNIDGVQGLADALELLRRSLETDWNSLHPRLDPDDDYDPSQRVNILTGLCGSGSVLRFLQAAPLLESKAYGRFSLRDVQIANGKWPAPEGVDATVLSATLKAAFAELAANNPAALSTTQAALKSCLDSVGQIEEFVTAQVGIDAAPNLQPLRDKLQESLYAMKEHMALAGLSAPPPTAIGAAAHGPDSPQAIPLQATLNTAPTGGVGRLGAINSRQDVILALDLICDYYAQFEPSSPVPLLAQRAKRLASKSFLEIIEDLAPDGLSQIRLIKGNDPDGDGH